MSQGRDHCENWHLACIHRATEAPGRWSTESRCDSTCIRCVLAVQLHALGSDRIDTQARSTPWHAAGRPGTASTYADRTASFELRHTLPTRATGKAGVCRRAPCNTNRPLGRNHGLRLPTGTAPRPIASAPRVCTVFSREARTPSTSSERLVSSTWAGGVCAMKLDEIRELHYICPIKTVPSIIERGILSHLAAARVAHTSIANDAVQQRRQKVIIPGGQKLHSYVNLYINGRNPMLYTVCMNEGVDSVCLLQVESRVLELPDVVVTDRNASSSEVRFSAPSSGLDRIDEGTVFARYWIHGDEIRKLDHKSRMCAEVLVPSTVDATMITGAYVGSEEAYSALMQLAPSMSVTVDKYKFFR